MRLAIGNHIISQFFDIFFFTSNFNYISCSNFKLKSVDTFLILKEKFTYFILVNFYDSDSIT